MKRFEYKATFKLVTDDKPVSDETLGDDEPDLAAVLTQFRAEEIEHRDIALKHGAEEAPAYPLLLTAIKAGSRLAIWLSTRI